MSRHARASTYLEVPTKALTGEAIEGMWDRLRAKMVQRSTVSLWWNQHSLSQEIGVLDGLIQQWERIASGTYGAPFWKQLERLFVLDEVFQVVPLASEEQQEFFSMISECIARDIEDVFQPCPDQAIMTAFGKSLQNLAKSKFDSGHTLQEMGRAQHRSAEQPVNEDTAQSMVNQAEARLEALRNEYETYPILHWFLGTLFRPLRQNNFKPFEPDIFEMVADLSANKKFMKWSTVGWIYEYYIDAGFHESISVGPAKRRRFQMLEVNVIPKISLELATLRAVLAGQNEAIESMKRQILAAASVVALSSARVCSFYFLEKLPEGYLPDTFELQKLLSFLHQNATVV